MKEVETGLGRLAEKGPERLAEQLVKEVEIGLGRLAEKGPERLAEQLVRQIETGLGRLAEIGVLWDKNGPSRYLGPNQ